MAHANYDCCAICDMKIDYAGMNAETKEELCPDCQVRLREYGIDIKHSYDTQTFIKWVKDTDADTVKKVLTELGFRVCYYSNEVDRVVLEKLNIDDGVSVGGRLLKDILSDSKGGDA